jgi:hypothetical protein
MSAEANKPIEDMTHEEALAALPRLRAEAATARPNSNLTAVTLRLREQRPRHGYCGASGMTAQLR